MEFDSLNTFYFEYVLERLVSTKIGKSLVIEGGWFDSL